MTEREKFIIRAALIYAQSNLDDVNQAFEVINSPDNDPGDLISVNGDLDREINESEVEKLLFVLQ